MTPYYKLGDTQLRTWADNFYQVATVNAAVLDLDPAELSSIDAARDAYVFALDNVAAARALSMGATATKNTEKGDLLDIVSLFANQFQSNPAVSDELIAELGLVVRGEGGGTVPLYPADGLTATGCSNGVNALKWQANGNEPGTTYLIQAAYDGTTDWEYVDVTTKTRYDDGDQTPGRSVLYRIIAKRSDDQAPPSNVAALYSGGGTAQTAQVA